MAEENKESEVEEKSVKDSSSEEPSAEETAQTEEAEVKVATEASEKAEAAAKAAEEAEKIAKEAIAKAEAAKAEAEAAAEAEYKAIADEVKSEAAKAPDYSFKRQGEEIFRRDMGEPEFWLEKENRFLRPILSAEEEAKITRKAEIFHDQTPEYIPEHVLSPEYNGLSNYERGVDEMLEVAKLHLETLKADPDVTEKQIKDAQDKITYLESLHENYFIGMNIFRTAKGGREKINA